MARSILKYYFNRSNPAKEKNNYIFFDHNKIQNKIDLSLTISRPETVLLKAETLSEYKLSQLNATISKDTNDLQKKDYLKTKLSKQKSVSRDLKFPKKQSITPSNRVDEIILWSRGYTIINDEDRKSTRLNYSHSGESRMPSSA